MSIRFHSYVASCTCIGVRGQVDALCMAYARGIDLTPLEFFGNIEAAIKGVEVLPDCLCVLVESGASNALVDAWDKFANQRETILQRGIKGGAAFLKGIYFFEWSGTGVDLADCRVNAGRNFKIQGRDLIVGGLSALLRRDGAVQIAPAGHVFKHPSKSVNKLFIQARELAQSESELDFLARSLISVMPNAFSDAKVIFIDTMGIYHIAQAIINIIGTGARIESHHSYGGINKLLRPHVPYVCLVSASTSGRMAEKLKGKGFDESRIVTLADVVRTPRTGSVLVTLEEAKIEYKKLLKVDVGTEIEIIGEHFSAKAKPPREVTLSIFHQPKSLVDVLKVVGKSGLNPINSKPYPSAKRRRVASVNGRTLVGSKVFEAWLEAEVSWAIPASVNCIVHVDDPASKRAATLAKKYLSSLSGGKRISVVSAGALGDEAVLRASGVLVICAISGCGASMRDISRGLRELISPDIPRHFLVCLGLPKTGESWGRLCKFLAKAPGDRSYGFSCWKVLAIGSSSVGDVWNDYVELARYAENYSGTSKGLSAKVTRESVEMAATTIENSYKGFLPTPQGNPLRLTDSYVFLGDFPFKSVPADPSQLAYFTIASAMQNARESSDPSLRLTASGYESVVVSPECFQRFNDSILQASILRSSLRSELDYSSSPDLSRVVKEFILKLFLRRDHAFGESALEFSAALAVGHLTLKKEDLRDLLECAKKSFGREPSALLGLLILSESMLL